MPQGKSIRIGAAVTVSRRLRPHESASSPGTMMVVGGIIGSGIFLNPAIVAQRVRTAGAHPGGLGAGRRRRADRRPRLRRARRPAAGGGRRLRLPARCLRPAAGVPLRLDAAAGDRHRGHRGGGGDLRQLHPRSLGLARRPSSRSPSAPSSLLSAVNYFGVRPGALTQNVLTVLKLGALGVLIVARAHCCRSRVPRPGTATFRRPTADLVLAVGAALVPVLFATAGWQQTNFVAEELIDPERNLPRALLAGVISVVAVYLLANLAYLRTLGIAGLARAAPRRRTPWRPARPGRAAR